MNLLAKRENEVPAELEKVFPGVDELVRNFFGRMIEPGSGLLRGSIFDSRWETEVQEKAVVVRIGCPGCKNGDFQLEIAGDILHFRLHHCSGKEEPEALKRHYLFRERSCAEYAESIKLPVPVLGEEAKAAYHDGVLTVTIPRDLRPEKAGKRIRICCGKETKNEVKNER